MTLYTVKMTTLKIVSRFDGKGQKIGEYTTEIPVTMHDLPHKTALAYQEVNPNGNVQIIRQLSVVDEPHRRQRDLPATERRAASFGTKTMRQARTEQSTRKSAIQQAAETGDMSAAINA